MRNEINEVLGTDAKQLEVDQSQLENTEDNQKFTLGPNGTNSLSSTNNTTTSTGTIPANDDQDSNKVDREFLNLKRKPLFAGSLMGIGPTGPDQLTTAVTMAGAIKYFGQEDLYDVVDYISQETWEDQKHSSREERIQELVNDQVYKRFRDRLSDFVHLVLGSCSNNTATNLVEFISLRGRYLGLDQLAGDTHTNVLISFASVEEINMPQRKFQALRDAMITSEMVQEFLKDNSLGSSNAVFHKVVIPQKSSTFSIDWEPLRSREGIPSSGTTTTPSGDELAKRPEEPNVLYIAITSRNGLFNTQTKISRNESGERLKKIYTILETYLVAQFHIKPIHIKPKAGNRSIRKR